MTYSNVLSSVLSSVALARDSFIKHIDSFNEEIEEGIVEEWNASWYWIYQNQINILKIKAK